MESKENTACIPIKMLIYITRNYLFLSATFGIIYVYSAEIYPTTTRAVGIGSSSVWARVGGIVAPYVGSLDEVLGPAVPLAIFGISAFLAGLLALFLPETMNRKIPDTIEEGAAVKCNWRDGIISKKN